LLFEPQARAELDAGAGELHLQVFGPQISLFESGHFCNFMNVKFASSACVCAHLRPLLRGVCEAPVLKALWR
jgi:hypothetical protein